MEDRRRGSVRWRKTRRRSNDERKEVEEEKGKKRLET